MTISNQLWNRIALRWANDKITPQKGIQAEEIEVFQRKYDIVLPPHVRDYFMVLNGTGDQMDNHLYRFWPFAELKPVHEALIDLPFFAYPDRFAYSDCFSFADHCISCWDYAVKLTQDSKQPAPVYRVTGTDPPGEMMAESFVSFMEKYAENPFSII